MRIAYCATVQPSYGGLRSFNIGLVQALATNAKKHEFELVIVTNEKHVHDFSGLTESLILFRKNHFLFENWDLPGILKKHNIDYAIFPHNRIPLFNSYRYKKICIFHDLLFWRYPERFSFLKRLSREWFMRLAVANSDFRFSVSAFTANELAQFIPGTSSIVCYQAISTLQNNQTNASTVLKEKGITKPYFLFIGAQSFQKNLSSLLLAFDIFSEKYHDYHLIIAGGSGTANEEIQNVLTSLKARSSILFPGFVTDDEKFNLMRSAKGFIFPSLYEGFGIPLLEAFQIGTPAICSNRSCLPEISGGAALEVEPDPENLAKAMIELAGDDTLGRKLIEHGKKREAYFTWQKTVEIILNSLKK